MIAEIHIASHPGRQRWVNTDNYLLLWLSGVKAWMKPKQSEELIVESQRIEIDDNGIILAVSEGKESYLAGEAISEMIVEAICLRIFESATQKDSDDDIENGPLIYRLYRAVIYADHLIRQEKESELQPQRIEATLTSVGINNEGVDLAHVGDSRAYLIRCGKTYCMTKSHLVRPLTEAEQIKLQKTHSFTLSNVIFQAVGGQNKTHPFLARLRPQRNDIVLLCSDGLSNKVNEAQMEKIVAENKDQLEMACPALIKQANEQGGEDNITVIMARLTGEDLPEADAEAEVRLELFDQFDDYDPNIWNAGQFS